MRTLEKTSDRADGKVDGIVAPVKGLNTQTPVAGLSQDYAVQLDNWVCQPDALVTRGGATNHVTGFASVTKYLMAYSSGTLQKMFATTDSGIYDATTAGAVGAAVSTLTNGRGIHVNFGTSAGQFLYFVNGADNAKYYDGAAWVTVTGVSAPAITGPNTNLFKSVETYRQRLFFLANNILGFYYLPADSVGGAATLFSIGSLCRLGGYAVGHGTWTIDGGSGPDDHYAIATSNGEIVIFKGSDPAVVANWVYEGTFHVGRPISASCFVKFGGDLLYLSVNGLIPMSTLQISTTQSYKAALTFLIQPTLAAAAVAYSTVDGWGVFVIPHLSLLLINVPKDTSHSIQYVYNTTSKGWSTFSKWEAKSFITFNGAVYFATSTVVAKAFTGAADFGAAITAICDTSYNRFGTRSQLFPVLARAVFAANALVAYTIGLAQDFSGDYAENYYTGTLGSGGIWNTGLWNTAIWGGSFGLRKDWVTITAQGGISISTRFKVTSTQASTVLLALDYKFSQQGLVS